jgi:2,3-dihydroxybenzoate decarboxylase
MQSYFRGYEDLSMPVWGFALDTSIHFLRIIFAGVFDEFPGLKIILGHLGEGLPFGMDRLNDHSVYYARRRGLKRTPADYLRENLIITTSGNFSVPSLLCTMSMLSVDNILFSVDWPYESLTTGVKFLEDLPISPNDKEKIAHLNAERLLRVPAQNSKIR